MQPSQRRGRLGAHPADALLALAAAALAVVVATTADLSAHQAWTLVAALAGTYIVGRGLSRGDWSGAARARRPPAHIGSHDRGDGQSGIAGRARALVDAVTPGSSGSSGSSGSPGSPAGAGRDSAEVTLHEERVHVESRSRPRERVRLRKHVVTEYVNVTVPLRREELRIERIPLDAPPDPDAELELTLMEDEPVVQTRIVPTERLRASKETVTEQADVDATVRREEAEIDIVPIDKETSP
jgi:uncharacterized protein (TIGR02271 family)